MGTGLSERPHRRAQVQLEVLTSDDQVDGDGAAVHLRLHGARVLPSMPQLDVADHDVSG